MRIVGLTGGIGMGKSTLAGYFRQARIPVFDADREVHRLQAPAGPAIAAIARAFPGVVRHGVLDRAALRARVIGDDGAMRRLEAIMHPLVRAAEGAFVRRARRQGRRLVVLDIPLLLESGAGRRVDVIVLATAPARVQLARVLARRGLNRAQARLLIARQMPDRQKQRWADVLIRTGLSRYNARRQLVQFTKIQQNSDRP